ncbi:MAG: glycosyltransferase family 87 protein [Bacteroidota bacterium]|nr:glycosyltransferase family 87 protein [Bacteroidota bacterium]
MLQGVVRFFKKPVFSDYRFILAVWSVLSVGVIVIKQLTHGIHGNYKIYKYAFLNLVEQYPLYQPRPEAYGDLNHYGPIFSVIMAPFALLPDILGSTLWLLCLCLLLFVALKELPLKKWQIVVICWLVTNSLVIAQTNVQFNTATAALIVLSYTMIKKEKDGWAAFMIMLGTFVKLYGIVGFAFFFFSKHKTKLMLWSLLWSVVFFVLPMLLSSVDFVVSQHKEWLQGLIMKNGDNNMALMQNVSLIGMIKKTTGHFEWSSMLVILPGILLVAISFLNFKAYKNEGYQLRMLASVLLFVVLFSTGSEPNTYIIALVGTAIWFVVQQRPFSYWDWGLLVFVLLLASFGPSDLFPRTIYKHYILPNALQALPCTLLWLRIIWEMVSMDRVKKQMC